VVTAGGHESGVFVTDGLAETGAIVGTDDVRPREPGNARGISATNFPRHIKYFHHLSTLSVDQIRFIFWRLAVALFAV